MGSRAALKRPPALRPGDLIAVAAPASPFDPAAFRRGAELIAARGYRVAYREDIFARAGYLAGDDARRAAELNGWLRDPEVRAILFARGGYGASRIVERLDYRALAAQPKALAGFSDATAVLLAVAQRAGVACFHGPMVARAGSRPDGARDLRRLLGLLEGAAAALTHRGLRPLRPGRVRAPLTGGNLSLLAHSVGTSFQVAARGRILFVEETGEALYRIDRAVRQLLLAGVFRGVAGIVLGQFTGIAAKDRGAVENLFLEALGGRPIPVVAGFPAGHGSPNRPFPLGVPATLDAAAGTLEFEPCVQTPPPPHGSGGAGRAGGPRRGASSGLRGRSRA